MKKLLCGVLVMLSLVTFAGVTFAQDVFLKTFEVKWNVNTGTCNPCDSTYKEMSMLGSTAVPDTSREIDTSDWAWGSALMPQVGSITTGALYAMGRVSLTTAYTAVACDTLFLAVDSSPDGTSWSSGLYVGYGQGTTGGAEKCLTAPIVVGIGATTAGSVLPAALSRYIRLRTRPDGATTAEFHRARLYVSALVSRVAQ
jgi:hypothetical protein